MGMKKILIYGLSCETNRGGKGIIGIINSPRNGNVSSSLVNKNDEIILSTDKGSSNEMCC